MEDEANTLLNLESCDEPWGHLKDSIQGSATQTPCFCDVTKTGSLAYFWNFIVILTDCLINIVSLGTALSAGGRTATTLPCTGRQCHPR